MLLFDVVFVVGAVVACCCVSCEAREILDKYYVRFVFLTATAELLWIFHTELDDLSIDLKALMKPLTTCSLL